MKTLIAVALVAAWSGSALAAQSVHDIQGSATILHDSLAKNCSDAAADAAKTGLAKPVDVDVCTDALVQVSLPAASLAATYLNRGVIYMARADYGAAVADFDQALRVKGDLVAALVDRGAAYAAEGQKASAVADFTQALALGTDQPEIVYFNRALAREDLGDLKGAYLDYRQAAAIKPDWSAPREQLVRFTVAPRAMS